MDWFYITIHVKVDGWPKVAEALEKRRTILRYKFHIQDKNGVVGGEQAGERSDGMSTVEHFLTKYAYSVSTPRFLLACVLRRTG